MVRLDYTLSDEQLEQHILATITDSNKKKLYVSNDEIYRWIIDGVNPPPIPITLNVIIPAVSVIPAMHLTLNIIKSTSDTEPKVSIEQ